MLTQWAHVYMETQNTEINNIYINVYKTLEADNKTLTLIHSDRLSDGLTFNTKHMYHKRRYIESNCPCATLTKTLKH